jgi:hypothetical protein
LSDKMLRYSRERQAGFALLSLILALAVLAFAYYYMMKAYYGRPLLRGGLKESVSSSGVDTQSYAGVINSAKEKVGQMNERASQDEEKIREMLKNSGSEQQAE